MLTFILFFYFYIYYILFIVYLDREHINDKQFKKRKFFEQNWIIINLVPGLSIINKIILNLSDYEAKLWNKLPRIIILGNISDISILLYNYSKFSINRSFLILAYIYKWYLICCVSFFFIMEQIPNLFTYMNFGWIQNLLITLNSCYEHIKVLAT